MNKRQLRPEFRAKLRDLIQGFIQHCEISPFLIGQIEKTFDHGEIRYGVPVFTFYGNPLPEVDTGFVGLLGLNGRHDDQLPAEILLQLIERLALQPAIAGGKVLRLMPVSNPIALERPDLPENELHNATLERIVEGFRHQYLDGLIEVRAGDQETLQIAARGDSAFSEALRQAREALQRLSNETSIADSISPAEAPESFEGDWNMVISVPRSWPDTLAVHWVSQLLVVFFRAHTDAQLRHSYSVGPIR